MGQKLANLLHLVWFGIALYLWNASGLPKPEFDTVSVTLTTLEVVIVISGIFGFTYFSYIAEKKAREVADEQTKDFLREMREDIIPPLIEREVRRAIQAAKEIGTEKATEADLQAMIQSLDKDEKRG